MKKVLNTMENQYGDNIPSVVLYQEEDGRFSLWEINCLSALHYGLGNCHCINHPASIETPVSTTEVVERFGPEALDGFDPPSDAQRIFDAFGIEAEELETALRVAYQIGANPLPALRNITDNPIVFSEEPNLLHFPDEEPGTTIFVVNGRGEISVVTVEGLDDPVMPELAIPGFE
jgi:hypothetical protein